MLTLVVGSIVTGEWHDHAEPISDEVVRDLINLDQQVNSYHNICRQASIDLPFEKITYSSIHIQKHHLKISKKLLDLSVQLTAQAKTYLLAFERGVAKITPCTKGGQTKDATIIEEYLEVCRLLKDLGYNKKRVFCTSNTKDFCYDGNLAASLAIDFAEALPNQSISTCSTCS